MRGFRDNLPSQYTRKIEFIKNKFENISRLHGFDFVHLPLVEKASLYFRTSGENSDVCNKELFEVRKYKGKFEDWVLRPEGTASCMRAIAEANYMQENKHAKFAYFAPMFRYNRPQKGRYRQFLNAGWEYIGYETIHCEFEILEAMTKFLQELGIKFELEINSIGSAQDRTNYRKILKERLKTDADPFKILDKLENFENLPTLQLNKQDEINFNNLQNMLTQANIKFKINPYLVRGLDYYNGLVFEFKTQVQTILAGGRYDNLMSQISNHDLAAVGFGAGVERLAEHLNYEIPNEKLAILALDAPTYALKIAQKLRNDNYACDLFFEETKLNKLLPFLAKKEYKYAIVCGKQEEMTQKFVAKNLETMNQKDFSFNEMFEFF